MTEPDNPFVSIIIRTYNEERYIEKCLEMLNKQTFQNYEIIIVDTESTDKTLNLAKAYTDNIIQIPKSDYTPGKSLNPGFRVSKGEVVVCISAHAIPFDDKLLTNLLGNFSDENVAAVTGKIIPNPSDHIFGTRPKFLLKNNTRRIWTGGSKDAYLANTISAIRKKVWEQHPFDENIISGEDKYWALTLPNTLKVCYEPTAVVCHSHDWSPKHEFFRAMQSESFQQKYQLGIQSLLIIVLKFVYGLFEDGYHMVFSAYDRNNPLNNYEFAFKRRVAIGAGRLLGGRPWIIKHMKWLNSYLSYLSSTLTLLTKKSSVRIHPKHLINNPHHTWYLPYISRKDRVLDIGCGTGAHSFACAQKANSVVGIDYSHGNVKVSRQLAAERQLNNIEFFEDNIFNYSKGELGSFDKVLLLDVLEHIDERKVVLQVIYELLKDDGLLFVSIPNRLTSWKQVQHILGLPYYSDPDHKIEYTKAEVLKELEENGFEPVSEFLPIVYDTPFAGFIDLLGGVSLKGYAKLHRYKILKAEVNPCESIGWRVVLKKRTK